MAGINGIGNAVSKWWPKCAMINQGKEFFMKERGLVCSCVCAGGTLSDL
jgi:hypothetical protein